MQLHLNGKKYNIDLTGDASGVYDLLTQEDIEEAVFSYLNRERDNDITTILKAFISLSIENKALKNEMKKMLQKLDG